MWLREGDVEMPCSASRSTAALVHAAHLVLASDPHPDQAAFLAGLGVLAEDTQYVLEATRQRCKQVRCVLG